MNSNASTEIERRAFLLASAGLLAALGTMRASAQVAPAETMTQWNAAQRIPLWPGEPPNGGFAPLPPRAGPPIPNFIPVSRAPELRVFRPVVPNGRSLLSIPGGAYTFVSIANEGVDVANVMTAKGYTVFVLVYRLPGEGWKGQRMCRCRMPAGSAPHPRLFGRIRTQPRQALCCRLFGGRASGCDLGHRVRREGIRSTRSRRYT